MATRVAVTGASGQVGRAIIASVPSSWHVAGADSSAVDIRNWNAIRDWIASERPGIVFHCAAKTDVDGCESDVENAFTTNALGPRYVAHAASKVDATIVYLSTNFVFDGTKKRPYHEFDIPNPLSAYGSSKLAGEREILASGVKSYIVRTSMVYDETGHNFVNTMLRLMNDRDELSIVDDQYGNPTYAPDLAVGIFKLISTQPPGVYHLTNTGTASWWSWADELLQIRSLDCDLVKISGADYERPATPPVNGALTSLAWPDSKLVMPDWRDALRRCLA